MWNYYAIWLCCIPTINQTGCILQLLCFWQRHSVICAFLLLSSFSRSNSFSLHTLTRWLFFFKPCSFSLLLLHAMRASLLFSLCRQRELLLLYNISPSRYIQQESFTLLALRHRWNMYFLCVSSTHDCENARVYEREPLAGLGSLGSAG